MNEVTSESKGRIEQKTIGQVWREGSKKTGLNG